MEACGETNVSSTASPGAQRAVVYKLRSARQASSSTAWPNAPLCPGCQGSWVWAGEWLCGKSLAHPNPQPQQEMALGPLCAHSSLPLACLGLTKVSGLGETAIELGDQSWHLEGSTGLSWYCSMPDPQPQLPWLAAGGAHACLCCGKLRHKVQLIHSQSHQSAGFTGMPLQWLFDPLNSCQPQLSPLKQA